MARIEKNSVDYFPFLCKEGKGMFYIEHKYGNDGYATWFKILRQLAVTSDHWLNLSDPREVMYLASKCRVKEEVLINIIDDLSSLGEFDYTLWKENKIIFNQKFVENIQDAYKRRNNKCITLDGLLIILDGLGIRKQDKCIHNVSINPHIIEYNNKEDNTIIKNTILNDKIENEILLEKETKFDFKKELLDYGFEKQLVEDWLIVRKNKKASNTKTAFQMFINEVEKNPMIEINSILKICCDKSWKGFKHEWLQNINNNGKGITNDRQQRVESVSKLKGLAEAILDDHAAKNSTGSN